MQRKPSTGKGSKCEYCGEAIIERVYRLYLRKPLCLLVGRAGIEPATNGLKVLKRQFFNPLI